MSLPEDARLVATDVDGTFVRSDWSVSPRTRAAWIALGEAGVHLVLVSGRPPRAMHGPLDEATGGRGLAICANGAYVYDLAEQRVVKENNIAPAVAAEVVRALRSGIPGLSFAVERATHFGHEPSFRPQFPPQRTVVAEVDELLTEPVGKILALHHDRGPDELAAEVAEIVSGLVEVTHSSKIGLIEISAVGVSKALALEELAHDLGVTAGEVVAFGDMPNDIPMLAWAGWAVAVANAHPDVLAIADEITASNAEDGVAVVLERMLEARHARPG